MWMGKCEYLPVAIMFLLAVGRLPIRRLQEKQTFFLDLRHEMRVGDVVQELRIGGFGDDTFMNLHCWFFLRMRNLQMVKLWHISDNVIPAINFGLLWMFRWCDRDVF